MRDLLTLLAVALLPVGGNALGALFAELARAPRWLIGAALHAAVGVAIAVVAVDLTPRALDTTPAGLFALLFAGGGAFSVLLSRLAGWRRAAAEPGRSMWRPRPTCSATA